MLMNIFGPKVEFSDENEKHGVSKICDMLSTEYKDHGGFKNAGDSEICRSPPEVSMDYLLIEFQLICRSFKC